MSDGTGPAAGWYPDDRTGGQRWWDGTGWTGATRPPEGPEPGARPRRRPPLWGIGVGAALTALIVGATIAAVLPILQRGERTPVEQAIAACYEGVTRELDGASDVDLSDIEVFDFGGAVFDDETGEPARDGSLRFVGAANVVYERAGARYRDAVYCTVSFEDGRIVEQSVEVRRIG